MLWQRHVIDGATYLYGFSLCADAVAELLWLLGDISGIGCACRRGKRVCDAGCTCDGAKEETQDVELYVLQSNLDIGEHQDRVEKGLAVHVEGDG